MRSKRITNFQDFCTTLGRNWKYAYKMFQQANEEVEGTIVSQYDDEGYCTFNKVADGCYEFTGTAK